MQREVLVVRQSSAGRTSSRLDRRVGHLLTEKIINVVDKVMFIDLGSRQVVSMWVGKKVKAYGHRMYIPHYRRSTTAKPTACQSSLDPGSVVVMRRSELSARDDTVQLYDPDSHAVDAIPFRWYYHLHIHSTTLDVQDKTPCSEQEFLG
jgi:hypothetical protein